MTERASSRPVTSASRVTKARLRWTWKNRLALGYLAVWCGSGDIGKSLFANWVIRGITRGELEGEFHGDPQDVLVISNEDGRADMWVPRLEAVGADLDRVLFLDYPPLGWDVRNGVSWIDRAVRDQNVPLVFVDALMSHMPDAQGGENTRSPTFVRAALQPLADLSKELSVTTLFSLHPRKAGGDTFADVVQESGVFTQLPRLGLLFGYHPDDLDLPQDQQRRVILRGKGNVGRNPGALSFRIAERFLDYGDDDPNGIADGVGYIHDVQPCQITERQLLHPKGPEHPLSKVEQAAALIRMALLDGEWHLAQPIIDELERQGLGGSDTTTTARKKIRARASKQKGVINGKWGWQLDISSEADSSPSSNSTPDSDSSVPRATLVPNPILPFKNSPIPSNDGKSRTIGSDERTEDEATEESEGSTSTRAHAQRFTCCCADGGELNDEGLCERCYGYAVIHAEQGDTRLMASSPRHGAALTLVQPEPCARTRP